MVKNKKTIEVFALLNSTEITSVESYKNSIFFEPIIENTLAEEILILYSGKIENLKRLTDKILKNGLQYKLQELPKEISSSQEIYEKDITEKYLSVFENVKVNGFYLYSTHDFGEKTSAENSKKLTEILEKSIASKSRWSNEVSQTIVFMSIINYLILEKQVLVHYLMNNNNEVDIETYLYDSVLLHYVRRHYWEPNTERSIVYLNNTFLNQFQKMILNRSTNLQEELKELDMLVLVKKSDRTHIDFLSEINSHKSNIFNIGSAMSDFMKYEELYKPKTVLIMPKRDDINFSIFDFVKSILTNSVPILIESNYKISLVGYPDLIEILERFNLVPDESLENLFSSLKNILSNKDEILSELMNSSLIKEITNDDVMRNKTKVLFNI